MIRAMLRRALERFPAKACPGLDPGWVPVRVKKTRQIKNLEPRYDPIGTEKALEAGAAAASAASCLILPAPSLPRIMRRNHPFREVM